MTSLFNGWIRVLSTMLANDALTNDAVMAKSCRLRVKYGQKVIVESYLWKVIPWELVRAPKRFEQFHAAHERGILSCPSFASSKMAATSACSWALDGASTCKPGCLKACYYLWFLLLGLVGMYVMTDACLLLMLVNRVVKGYVIK